MKTHEALRFLRKKSKFAQKELLPELDASVYSRIEGGKQGIRLDDLKKIINNLSISAEEIFSLAPINEEQTKYLKLFYFCSRHLQHQTAKEKMMTYYKKLENKHKNLRELSNYVAIKSYFAPLWEEIEGFTKKETEELYQSLISKTYYQLYDYKIMTNTVRFFDKKQIDALMVKVFRIFKNTEVEYQSNPVGELVLNVITFQIYERDYAGARHYISLARKYDATLQNFYYRMNLKYFENLLNYLETGKYHYLRRIYEYIALLKDVDDPLAIQIETEVELVIHGILDRTSQNKVPIGVYPNN